MTVRSDLAIDDREEAACDRDAVWQSHRDSAPRSKSACSEEKRRVKLNPMRGEFYDIE